MACTCTRPDFRGSFQFISTRVSLSCLVLIFLSGFFGPGMQSSPLSPWVFFTTIAVFLRTAVLQQKRCTALCFLYIVVFFGIYSCFMSVFADPTLTSENAALSAGACIIVVLLLMPTFIIDSYVFKHTTHTPLKLPIAATDPLWKQYSLKFFAMQRFSLRQTLVFPACWIVNWYILAFALPTGSMGMFAAGQGSVELMVTWSTYIGWFGVEFLLVWFGSCAANAIIVVMSPEHTYRTVQDDVHEVHSPRLVLPDGAAGGEAVEAGVGMVHPAGSEDISLNTGTRLVSRTLMLAARPLGWYGGVIMLLTFCSTLFSLSGSVANPLFQKVPSEKAVPVACIIGIGRRTRETYLSLTEELASRNQLVVLSETATSVASAAEEQDLFDKLAVTARKHHTHIGVGYQRNLTKGESDEWTTRNMFAFITPSSLPSDAAVTAGAKPAFIYQKAHPVPGVEFGVEPGPAIVPLADLAPAPVGVTPPTRGGVSAPTPWLSEVYSGISAAICFDLDFPQTWLRTPVGSLSPSAHDRRLFLHPSWTWGSIGYMHAQWQPMHVGQLGVDLLSCSAGGFSLVVVRGQVFSSKYIGFEGHWETEIPVGDMGGFAGGTPYAHSRMGGGCDPALLFSLLVFVWACVSVGLERKRKRDV